jgi:uncharacterized protein (UPF0276 family)
VVIDIGLSWRRDLNDFINENSDIISILEIIPEHFIGRGTKSLNTLNDLAKNFSITSHSVSLSLGSAEFNKQRLDEIAKINNMPGISSMSEHISWTTHHGFDLGHLGPMEYSNNTLNNMINNIFEVKEKIKKPLTLENITYTVNIPSDMSEMEFITKLLHETGCGLLLDVTNLFINSKNHMFSPIEYLKFLPKGCIEQIHLSGFSKDGSWYVDSHSKSINQEVIDLFEFTLQISSPSSIVIERDSNFVKEELLNDLSVIDRLVNKYHGTK